MAARSLLLKLERRGLLALPPRRQTPPRCAPGERILPLNRPGAISEALSDLQSVHLNVLSSQDPDYVLFSRYLSLYHYLGYHGPVGENLAYLARDRHGRELACVLFGAAAWKTEPRDRFIGWDPATRASRLSFLTNNTRFLILPWVQVPQLASHLLGRVTRRLSTDWQAKYAHALYLVETFVERDRFRGTCYQAANWTAVGHTKGRSRQDRHGRLQVPVKGIYLYALTARFREELCRVDA